MNLSSRHDERVKITRSELSKDINDEATAYARFHPDPAVFPHHYHLAPLPVISHLHPHQYGPPHGLTTMLQPIRQAPAIAVGESLVPINMFDALQAASQSQAKSDAIVQKMAESVQKIAESLSLEVDLRVRLKNQVEQQGVSQLQGQEDIRQLQMVQAQGAADFQGLWKKVDEEAAEKEELKNVVHELKTKIEVLVLTSLKQNESNPPTSRLV